MELITTKEASELLRIHLNTVYRLLETGELKGVKIGDSWRIDKIEIERLVRESNPEN